MGKADSYWGKVGWLFPPAPPAHPNGGVFYGNGEWSSVPGDLVPYGGYPGWYYNSEFVFQPGEPNLLGGHLEYGPGGNLLFNTKTGGWRDPLSSEQLLGFRVLWDGTTVHNEAFTSAGEFTGQFASDGRALWRIIRVENEPGVWEPVVAEPHEMSRLYPERVL
jgi:hypothetical protein